MGRILDGTVLSENISRSICLSALIFLVDKSLENLYRNNIEASTVEEAFRYIGQCRAS